MKKSFQQSLSFIGSMLFGCIGFSAAPFANEKTASYQTLPFELSSVGEHIIPVDMNGDGLPDLLVSNENTLSVYLQKDNQQRFNFKKADVQLELPGKATGWDVDYAQGRSTESSTQRRILAVVDGKRILAWGLEGAAFAEPKVVMENVGGFLPPGFYPLRFVRDVNSDGYSDFLVPTSGKLRLFLGDGAGSFSDGMDLSVFINESANLFAYSNLQSRVGGSVNVGALQQSDINNDGRNDIISQTDGKKQLFLADGNGRYPQLPSMESELVAEFKLEPDDFIKNFDNLSALANRVNFDVFGDVNGDEIDDYIVKEGNKVSLYFGDKNGFDLKKPNQILKSSGNLLSPFFYDEDGDGRRDLVLLRIENLSLADLIIKAVFATNIKVENYVYRNKGDGFATRPHRKVTITLDLPALIKMPSIIEEFEAKQFTRSIVAALDDDRKFNDLLLLREKTIEAYTDIELLGSGEVEDFAEAILGIKPGKDNYTFNINDIGNLIPNPVLQLIKDQTPNFIIPIELTDGVLDLKVADFQRANISNDKRDDFFVFTERKDDSVSGYLLISK